MFDMFCKTLTYSITSDSMEVKLSYNIQCFMYRKLYKNNVLYECCHYDNSITLYIVIIHRVREIDCSPTEAHALLIMSI